MAAEIVASLPLATRGESWCLTCTEAIEGPGTGYAAPKPQSRVVVVHECLTERDAQHELC